MRTTAASEPDARGIPFARTVITPEARRAVAQVLGSGWVTTGPQVAEFEREFAAFLGVEHAVAVSSCTAGIELALRALRLPPGAKVLTSTMTFCGAVNAILHAGHQPVLCDINPDTLMPDPATSEAAARRVGGVDAALVLHFAGYPAPVQEIAEAARRIASAEKPVLYVGGGTLNADACAELLELAEAGRLPVVTTLMAKSAFPETHELHFGWPGMHGPKWSNWALN